MFNFRHKPSSRKYIDLIYRSVTKWGVWDPSTDCIEVGDYGTIEADGHFKRKGNIYKLGRLAPLMKAHPPVVTEGNKAGNVISITSSNAKMVNIDPGFSLDAQLAEVTFKGSWSFASGSAAVLAIHKPVYKTLPRELDVDELINNKALKGMYVVTSVTTCASYASYLASKEEKGMSIALCAQSPIPSTPLSAGPEISVGWKYQHGGGIYRDGHNDENSFTVLFELRLCKEKKKGLFRDKAIPNPVGLERLADAPPPWDILNDEGEEDSYCEFQEFENEDLSDEGEMGY